MNKPGTNANRSAVDRDLISLGLHPSPENRDRAVHDDATLGDQHLTRPSATESEGSEHLLEALTLLSHRRRRPDPR